MNRKNIPLLLMLTAGAVTCIITYVKRYSMNAKLISLFVVLVIFYVLLLLLNLEILLGLNQLMLA